MNTAELQWPRSLPGELIGLNEIHVWFVFLDDFTSLESKMLQGFLSPDELARAERFHFEKDQKRYIAAHGMLRKLLACYLQRSPHEICFEYSRFGKPEFEANASYNNLRFNLSHSSAFALYAITRGRNIGIDIEIVREDIAYEQIARRFFSAQEIRSLESIHENERCELFFQYWTRKEAFLKAIGKGVSFPMENCDVSLISGSVRSPIKLLGNHREDSSWYAQDLFLPHGYAAAIVAEGDDWELSCWQYSE